MPVEAAETALKSALHEYSAAAVEAAHHPSPRTAYLYDRASERFRVDVITYMQTARASGRLPGQAFFRLTAILEDPQDREVDRAIVDVAMRWALAAY